MITNDQYVQLLAENQRTALRLSNIEQTVREIRIPEVQQLDTMELIKCQRNIEMLADKYRNVAKNYQNIRDDIDQKLNVEEFLNFTQKIARDYVTMSILEMSLPKSKTIVLPQEIQKPVKYNKMIQTVLSDNFIFQEQISELKNQVLSYISERLNEHIIDFAEPFRVQIQSQVTNCYAKLHILERSQLDLARYTQIINQNDNVSLQLSNLSKKIQSLEMENASIKSTIQTQSEQIAILEQKVTECLARVPDPDKKLKLDKKQIQQIIEYVNRTFETQTKSAELVLRLNQFEDHINSKMKFDVQRLDLLDQNIQDIESHLSGLIFDQDAASKALDNQQNEFKKQLTVMNTIKLDKSELFQILDNQNYNLKVQSMIQQMSDKNKEVLLKALDLMECQYRFSIQNKQNQNKTDSDKILQKQMLIKQCENVKSALNDFYGQSTAVSNQQSSMRFESDTQTVSQRPQSVGARKMRVMSQTPKYERGNTFCETSRFFQRKQENPLVQRLRKSVHQ